MISDDPIDNVMAKVRKLLALSKSSNPHEAAAAAARAAALMHDYQLEEAAVMGASNAGDEPAGEHTIERAKGRNRQHWRGAVADGCAELVGGRMFWHGPDIKIVGRAADAKAAAYMTAAICNDIERVAKSAAERDWTLQGVGPGEVRSWYHAFRLGCARVIRARLHNESQKKRAEVEKAASEGRALLSSEGATIGAASTALVVIDRRALAVKSAWETIFPPDEKRSLEARGPTLSSQRGYVAGRAAGHRIDINARGGAGLNAPRKQVEGVEGGR